MNLYDECLNGANDLISSYPCKSLEFKGTSWVDAGKNQIIFQSDTAYELGGGNLSAISSIALTSDSERVPCDEVILCGKDLNEIKGDVAFARIAIIRVNEEAMGSSNALYNSIRKIEYTRYHLNPEGYMMRISSFNHREAVRISKDAIKKGLDFARVGKMFIDSYHEHSQVEAVKLYFITNPDFDFTSLEGIMQKSEDITMALDHLTKNVKMDCNTCSLKPVCDEVEELYNQDFEKNTNINN